MRQPLDRTALQVIVVLSLLIGLLVWGGDHTVARVRDFSWQDQQIGSQDTAFVLTFNRPMNWDSVAANLKIHPPLPGKLSWSGRRLAYTLTQPIPYGQQFRLELANATESRPRPAPSLNTMRPFVGQFHSRDLAFVYLGVKGDENGRLVLSNLTQGQKQILTPEDLTVLDFKPYSERDRILFTAVPRTTPKPDIFEQQLYAVTTGLSVTAHHHQSKPGQLHLLLDHSDYQILNFDLAADGQTIVVQRFARNQQEPVSLWLLTPDRPIQRFPYNADGKFLISPDSRTLAISRNQGVALMPISSEAPNQPIDFFSQFRQILGFSQDGTAAVMERQHPNSTRSLFLVASDGTEQELLTIRGYFLAAQLDTRARRVYCLYSQYNTNQRYRSDLHLDAISLETGQQWQLATSPGQLTGHLSLAPDGSALLYDKQTVTGNRHSSVVRNIVGQTITDSALWLLPLPQVKEEEETEIVLKPRAITSGVQAQWFP